MALSLRNVTFDAADPRRQAAFWAAALGYETSVVEADRALVIKSDSSFPRLWFFRVPEPKIAKNRVHLDLGADDMTTEVDRLHGLGATPLGVHEEHGVRWTVLTDPEGNEFCVAQRPAEK